MSEGSKWLSHALKPTLGMNVMNVMNEYSNGMSWNQVVYKFTVVRLDKLDTAGHWQHTEGIYIAIRYINGTMMDHGIDE